MNPAASPHTHAPQADAPAGLSRWTPGADAAAPPPGSAVRLYARPSANFADKLQATEALLRQAAAQHRHPDGRWAVTQASSLGAEDVVITHLINRLGLGIPVFVLETGALHPETLALLAAERADAQAPGRAPITVYTPQHEAVVQFVAREGADAMVRSVALRKACCGLRKLEPLARALEGHTAWITGLRREQSSARADVPPIDTSEQAQTGRVKYNPLADWTWGDVWHCIAQDGVRYNPLHDRFFPSIGCAPCTRAITLGEDFRSGRWWWEDESAKECGLHVAATPTATSATTPTAPTPNDAP